MVQHQRGLIEGKKELFESYDFKFLLTWMRGNFGQKLQNCLKLPPIVHVGLYCNVNEKS